MKPHCPACSSTFCIPTVRRQYWHCFNCGTVYVPGGLPQEDMVGGTGQEERIAQHGKRIERLNKLVPGAAILDFGCGNGQFLVELAEAGFQVYGYDKFNPTFERLPDALSIDAATMIEVIEHLGSPSVELTLIHDTLKKGGFLMVESTLRHDDPLSEVMGWEYLNPDIGHCTIFSAKGLDALMKTVGFELFNEINRNVRVYRKL